jgi:hypothetical protein
MVVENNIEGSVRVYGGNKDMSFFFINSTGFSVDFFNITFACRWVVQIPLNVVNLFINKVGIKF